MPSRNGSEAYGRSLRADIAVLNPATNTMEFATASRVKVRSIEGDIEGRDWTTLADRIERQTNGPIFQPDFKITDEVRKDLESMFLFFKLETEDYKSGKNKDVWNRYGEQKDFETASEAEIKEFLARYRLDLIEEVATFRKYDTENNANSEVFLLGKDRGSQERIDALEKLRGDSEVKEVIYRGQDAYEVLDAKKAAEIIRQKRREDREGGGDSGYRKGIGYTGSEGDGLYHLTPAGGYASGYGSASDKPTSGVIQGVLSSKKLLDLTEITAGAAIHHAINNKEYVGMREKYFGKGNMPPLEGWDLRGSQPSYEEVREFNKAPHRSEAGYTNKEYYGSFDESDLAKWKWTHAVADVISKNYERVNGKPMPASIGLSKTDNDTRPLQERLYSDMDKRHGVTYQLLKTPTFKKVLKQAGFDAVKYLDTGVGRTSPLGTPAYGATKPTQFKSYFGSKKVDLKSPNMFDAD